jgi:hypothetical protein
MLYLKKGTVSKVHLTLGDLRTLTGGHFLFVFKNRGTGEQKAWTVEAASDISLFPERYNAFNVDTDAVLGQDAAAGTWAFQIYEQPNGTNLDPELATGLLESGMAILEQETAAQPVKYSGAPKTFQYYQA